MIRYHIPVEGLDEDGDKITCDMAITMDTDDAINVQRMTVKQHCEKHNKPVPDMSRQDLLTEFITVHWAETF
jgi:hypothetical protein